MKNRIVTPLSKLVCALVWLIFSATVVAQQKQPVPLSKVKMIESLKETQNTISFIENKGQWSSDVKIAGNTNIGNMYVTNDHLHFISFENEKHEEGEEHEETEEDEAKEMEELEHREVHGWGIYMDGSNANYTISKEKDLTTKYNYLIGESYHGTDASSFGELTLNNLYNGIDLRIYSQKEHVMEFDWLVDAGADFSNIKMRFKGQDGLSIDEKGNLSVKLEFDAVKFDIPEAYQVIDGKKVMVKMAFVLNGDVATFKALSKIDSRYALIIDPSVKWGTWFDNNSDSFDEYLFAVDVDNAGNVYCGGNINVQLTSGAGNYINPATLFGLSNTYGGSVDGILYKFNPNGTAILAITYFGSSANDRLYGMALSPDYSTIMFCGLTAGTIPTGSNAAFDGTRNGTDGFVGVLSASTLNTLAYSTYLGDAGTDEMVTIRPLSNNSFVVGGTLGNSVPAAYIANAYDPNYSGSTEMYLAKFSAFSTLTFGTYVGGTGTDQLNDIQIYSDGAIAFSGSSGNAASFPSLFNNAANGVANTTGGLDGVLGVLPANGGSSVLTLSRFGGTSDDEFYGITIGPFDTLFVTGFTSSNNLYLGPNSAGRRYRTVSRGGQEGLIGKFPKNGWSGGATDPWAATYFGGSGNDRGNTLRTYTPYAVMVFGETASTATDTTNRFSCKNLSDGGSFYDSTHNGGTWDIFYLVLGTDLQNLYFGTYIGGGGNDYLGQTGTPHGSNHFVVEGDSLICLGTTVHSNSLTPNPITAGVFDPNNSTGSDDIHLIFKWRIGILLNFDYADAPASYGTPNHVVFNSLTLGSRIDREDFAQPSYRAYKDDSAWSGTPLVPALDDEDGIAGVGTYSTQVYVQDTSTRFTQIVNVTNTTGNTAILCGWIDFNRSGTFGDAAYEVDTVLVPSGATTATLRFTGYNVGGTPYFGNTNDTTYMRLRLTTQASFFSTNPSPTLNANNGEVEDYMVLRFHCVDLSTATIDTNSTSGCGTATGSIVITNDTLIAGVQYGVYYSKDGGPLQGPFFYTTTGTGNIAGTLTISGLTAGTYTAVQIFHPTNPACGFTLPGSYVIKDPNVPGAPTIVSVVPNPVCTGASFTITASGQTGATFTWRGPGGFTFTGNPLTRTGVTLAMAGQYSVKQTLNSCTSDSTITTVSVVQTPTILSLAGSPLTSCNSSTGTITVNGLTSGTSYTVNFTLDPSTAQSFSGTANGSGQIIITGLPAGTYRNFTATTTIGSCTSPNFVGPVTITNPTPPGQPTASVTPANLCVGQQFTLTATGTAGATFAWSGPNGFTGTGSPLVVTNAQTNNTGSYTVVQTLNNCPSIPSAGVSVTVNPNPVIGGTSSTNPLACGGNTGTITLSGLTNGVVYVVNYTRNPATPQSTTLTASAGAVVITGLTAGTYSNFTVTVQSTGCVSNTIAGPITLTDPSTPLAPTLSSNSPICSGTTLTLFATGTGTSYNWTSNVGFSSTQQNPTRANSTTSMSGQYCATTTITGCTSPQACINVTVNQTPAITGTAGTNPTTCSGVNGAITISGLTTGLSYNVAYTKTPGGAQSAGPLTANGSGQITINGLSAGLYTNFTVSVAFTGVTCTSANFPGNVTLSDPTTPAPPTVGSNSPVCSGNSINLTASGVGTAYTWTGPSFTSNQQNPTISSATTSMSGSYCATQTLNACTSPQACVTVTVNQTPSISGTTSTNPTTCLGAQGTITLSGLDINTVYTLNYDKNSVAQGPVSDTSNASGQIVITGLTAGTYANFRVTLLGCTSPTIAGPVTLTDPATPSAPTAGSNSPVCSGGTISLTASGTGGGYSWSGPGYTSSSQNPSIVGATTAMTGNYCVTQTIAACTSLPGCVSVTVNPTPTISFSSSAGPSTCGGSNGSITLSGLSANTTYLVNYIKTPPGTAQGPVPILSNASGQIVITGLTAGSYSNFTATLTGCSSSTLAGPISLSDPSTPSAPTVTGSTPVCSGNTITLTASGVALATYSWTGPGFSSAAQNPTIPNATTSMTGSYCATQTLNACTSAPACTSVVVNQTPAFAIGGSSNPTTCLGNQGTITLSGLNAGANYGVTYLFGATPQAVSLTANALGQLVITGLSAGSYSNFVVTLTSTGCPSATVVGPVALTDPSNPSPPTLSSNSPRCYGDTLKLFASTVAGGTYSWSGPGSFTSTVQNPTRPSAVPAMSGTYSVTVTVANCNSTPATISVTVTSCPPIAVNDNYSTPEDVTLTVTGVGNLLSNDSDPANPQQPLTVNTTPACNPQHGSVTILANGNFTYIPNANYTGLDTFCYTVCDNEVPPACATALAIINVTPVNDPPVVRDSTVTTPEDVPITVCLPISDPESSTQAHVVTLCGGPANGSLNGTLSANNGSLPHTVCFTYTPTLNYNGTDQICISICDNGSPVLCDTATVTINVTPVNDPPAAVDDYFTNCVGAPIVNNVMTNDSDVDGPLVTALGVLVPPVSGSVILAGTGAFTYTPPTPLFNGLDSFRYVICDGGTPTLCDTATVTLDYRCVNVPPIARDDNYTTNEDQTLVISAPGVMSNDNDPDGGTITVNTPQLTGPSNGTLSLNANGSFTYVPNPNYTGPDQFTYSICDNGTPSKCDTATVFITVLPVNDPPVVVDSVINTCEDCPPVTLCLPINDIETDQDYYVSTLLCGPNSGTVSTTINNTSNVLCITYDSNNNFNGLDSICVVVCDNGTPNLCDTTKIRITVTPVNDPPIAVNDNYTTTEDANIVTSSVTGVRNNDNDIADGNAVTTLTVNTVPVIATAHGTLTLATDGSFNYVPAINYCGTDSFQYQVCDAGTPLPSLCDTATAYITITCVNEPPVVVDTPITTCEDCGPITVCIPVTDPDVNTTTTVAGVFCGPNSGTASTSLVLNTLCVTYTSNTNFNGLDSICVIVCDNGTPQLCDTTHVTITVTPVNDPPIAVNDNYSTNEDATLTIPAGSGVRANDNDNVDGNPVTSLTVTTNPVVPPVNGTLTLNADGSFTYIPNTNYSGLDSFQYRICDNGTPLPSLCDTATAYITIVPANDPPVVVDTPITTPEDNPITVCIPISDPETSTQQHTVSFCDVPDNGIITSGPVVNNGVNPHTVCITYSPNANFNGLDSICLTVCDNGIPALCDNTIIRITVTPVNDPPVAVNNSYTTTENTNVVTNSSTGVRPNDNDNADGNPVTSLTVNTTPVIPPVNGTVTLNADGSFTYNPNPNYNGLDSFQYQICDAGTPLPSLCDTATVYITITNVNYPPDIPDTTVTTCEDCPINVCIPYTDQDTIDTHSATLLCPPSNGTVSGLTVNQTTNEICFTYTGYANLNGLDSLCVVVCDNGNPSLCDTTTVVIVVTPVNDPPYADTLYAVTYENTPVGVNVAAATGDLEGDPLSYTYGGVIPNSGTYGITGNGAIVFVPNPGFTGTVTIPYTVCDLSPYPVNILCDGAAIVITVLPSGDTINNHAPLASNDYVTTPINTSIVVNELANDYDPDGDPLSVTVTGAPSNGTYTVNPNGTINYTPNTGFFGSDTIDYVICDPVGTTQPRPLCDNAMVIIFISRDPESVPNDAPVAVDDFATICADANATVNVLLNDNDPNGDAITSVTVIDGVNSGTTSNPGLGIYIYDPNTGFSGTDTLTYQICDNGTPSLCDTAVVVFTVNPTPVITPSAPSLTVCSGDAVNITFSSNVSGTVFTWSGSNGTSGTGNISTALTNSGTTNTTVTYTVTGVAGGGCGSNTLSIPVTVRPRPVVTFSQNNTTFCSGDQVVVNLFSTIPSTSFTWSGSNGSSGTGNIITDNPTNTGVIDSTVVYTINSSFNGCSGTPVTVSVIVKPRPALSATPSSQTVCSGTPITINISSSVPGSSVNWTSSNGNSGNTFTINDSPINLGASNITVTYTINGQYNGCAGATTTATVVVRPRVIADAGQDKSVTACSASCVSIGGSPTGNGGSGTLTYAWSPRAGLNDSTLANPTACNINTQTTYTVTVTDASGCSATDAMTITVTPSSLTAEAGVGGALCLGSGDSVMLGGFPTAVGGTPTYTYTWFPTAGLNLTNPANPMAFPASTTTYYLTVTDALGCTSIDSAVVTVYPVLVANAGRDTAVCATFGAPLGGNPTAAGGSGNGYTYTWNPTTGLDNINSANPVSTFATAVVVTYSVTVLDGNGCSATDNVVVTVRPNPIAQAGPDKTLTTCPGDSITLGDIPAVTSGTGPFTYSWAPSTGFTGSSTIPNPVVKGLAPGTYTYTLSVVDANLCSSSDNVVVTVVPNTLQAQAGNDESVCSNNNCVQIGGLPTAVGGVSPYTYAWSNSGTLSSGSTSNPLACPTAIGATTYTVTVTDSKGCTATDAEIVIVNPTPTVNAGPDTSVCFGSSILIGGNPTATGGTPGYTYAWQPTIGLSLPNVANPDASPSVVTTYQLIVTDSRGCANLDEVTVTPRSTPVVDAGADKSITQCPNDTAFIGNIPVVVSGGTGPFEYNWTPGTALSDSTIENPFVVGLGSTTSYQIIVTDVYGCQGVDYVIVNVTPNTLQVDAGNGGSLCASAGSSIVIGGNPTAAGGTTPYTYAWASSVGGFSSSIANPTVAPTGTTTYYVTVTDAKGCSQTDSVVVTINTAPAVNAGVDDTICSGFCVTIGSTPTGSAGTTPYQYSWTPTLGLNANNTPNPLACPLITTTYTVQLTDSNGCVATDAVTITVRPNPVANAGVDRTLVNCGSDSVQIGGSPSGSGGTPAYTYAWSPATGLVSPVTSTNPWVRGLTASQLYTLVVTDANGCTAEDAVLVNVVPSSLVADAGNGGSYCAGSGGTVTLGGSPTANGGSAPFVYAWSGGLPATSNPVAGPLSTTKYYVTVTDSKGCVSVDSATVTVNLSPTANAGVDTAICAGEDVTLGGAPSGTGGTPGYNYSWTPGIGLSSVTASNPTATPSGTTTYVLSVTDVNGCSATDNIAVTVRQNPVADAGADQTLTACSSDSVQIGGSPTASGGGGIYTYGWTPGLGLDNSTVANPYVKNIGSTSNYVIVVTDQFGCTATDQVSVVVNNPSLIAEAGNDVSFCAGASVSVTLGGSPTAVGGTPPYTYTWPISAGLNDSTLANPVATPTVTTTYPVVVRDANGCLAEDTVRITINPRPVVNAGLPDTTCSGECIVLGGAPTASNGTGSYTYNWTPAFFFSTSTTIANPTVCPTNNVTYVVTATDSLGCSNTASVSIRVNQNPVANAGTDKVLVSCPDACVVIGGTPTATGGGGGYLYAWAPSAGLNNTGLPNPSACNLSQDVTYNLTVTDANGCTAIDQVLVDVQQSTLAADAGNDKSICAGQTTCITIGGSPSVSGGSVPYTLEWSPVAGICNSNVIANPDVNPTDTTTYVLLVTDALGCIAIDSMVVFANPAVTASVGPDTSICQGGSALLGGSPTGSGGTSPFTYNWGPGTGLSSTTNSNPIATPLVTTAYCVTVTDFVGCSSSTCQNVNVNAGVSADAGQDQTITNCPGASLQIGGSPAGFGGSGNYTYAWSPNTGLSSITVPNPFVTNLTVTTTYTLTVTDNTTGCIGIDQVTITVIPSTLVAGAGPDKIFCANSAGCIPIGGTTTGGVPPYLYQWAPVTGLSNGNVQNPCAAPLFTTTYHLTVTDQLGCNVIDSMVVIVSPMIAVNAGTDSSICQGTSILLGGNPAVVGGTTPYTYAWSAGAFPSNVANPIATPLSNSSYTLTVTDSLGCSSSDIVNINVRQLPIANAGVDQTITSCSNDSAILGGSPTGTGTQSPYTYFWSPASLVSDATAANPVVDSLGNAVIFTVTVTDAFGCQATDQVQVTATPPVINVEAGANIGSLCSNTGGCVTLGGNPTVNGNGLPPYTYLWTGAGLVSTNVENPVACPTGTTTYTVVVTDANGCQAADTVQVIVNTPTEASISGLNSQYCVGSPNVVMTGIPAGGTFGGPFVTGNVFQPSSAGTWCVNYTYTNPSTGCVDDTIICVTVNPLPVVSVSGFNANVCVADPLQTLVGTPAGGFFTGSTGLSGANGEVFTPATATIGNNNITYTYTDPQTGCANTFSFVINVKGAPSITISGSDSACAGGTVVLTPTYSFDVFNIAWSVLGGGTIASGLNPVTVSPAGLDYCVIATAINTPNGCVARDTFCIHVNQAPLAVDDELSICEEQTGTVDVVVNDSDPEGNSSNVTVISAPNGTTSVSNGVITYTGSLDYNGTDLITYLLCNTNCPTACDTGVVLVNICPINDPPVIEDTTITIYQDDTADVCPTIYDVDGDPLVISDAQCTPLNGTIIFTSDSCFQFIPTPGWNGTQVICVVVCDTAGLCDTGTITIVVLPTNNAPVTSPISVSVCDSTSIGINVSASATDPDGDPLNFSYGNVTAPSGAVYTVNVTGNGAIVFEGNLPGTYTFDYYVCDNSSIPVFSLCDTNTVTVTVVDCDTVTANQPPVANDDHVITTPATGTVINELANDFDPDGDPLTPTIISGPYIAGASAVVNPDGTITYISPTEGLDSIVYSVCDPFGLCDTAVIYINIADSPNTNHPPVAVDDFETTDYLTPVVVDVLNNDHDPDGDSIHVTIIPCPASDGVGVISGNGSTITYTPGPNANADNPDTLCYVICEVLDGTSCDTANVVIYINNSVQGVADCGNNLTGRENPIDIDVTANDFDPETDSFWVVSVLPIAGTTHGTGSVNNDGTIHYVPANDTCDYIDTISYVIQDVRGATDTVNVCIYINCCTTPVAVTDLATIISNDVLVIDVQNNDSLFGVPATTTIVVNGAHGSATVNGSVVTYSPSNNYCGLDTVQYSISSSCGSDTGLLIVTVTCNQNPVAVKDNLTMCVNDTATINVFANDTDPEGDSLFITALGNPFPANLGFVVAVDQGNVTFQSNGTAGTFSVNYIVCDAGLPSKCDTNSVIVQVLNCIVPDIDTIYDTTCVVCPDTICIGDWVVGNNYPTISNLCDPQNGTVEILADSLCFVYTPAVGFIGNDTFCITVCDTLGDCDSAVVIITVLDPLIQAVDQPCDLDTAYLNTPITIAVLDNDILPSAADTTVTLLTLPVNGTAVVNADNTVTYTPNPESVEDELFSYLVCANSGAFSYCDTATICITVVDTFVECFIPNGFSPNGDGVNDNYVIPCKDKNPEATVRIFDRWGVEVWFSDGPYNNDWDGHNMQGIVLPDGTYYIIYEYLDGTGKREAKFVVIHR